MKFRNKKTGSILEPRTALVEAQMLKCSDYEVVEEIVKEPAPAGEKPLNKLTKAELEALAAEKGIEIPEKATKDEIVKLLEGASEE